MAAESLFVELSVIVIIALVVASIARALKQPLVVGYIITGVLVSPYFFDLVKSTESIETFGEIGVAVLLFMVGLNLNPKVVKDVGKVALITGLGQIAFTLIIGFTIAKLLGFASIEAVYIALALSFSSTIIIMKLLSDKGDTYTLYGKIATGFLIIQDIVAIVVLMVISSIDTSTNISSLALGKLGYGAMLITALAIVSIFFLPSVTKLIARSQELLFLFSVGWALAIASLFDYFGFSIESGALLAGISLSVSPYRYEIGSKMRTLRDFFILLFFIIKGMALSFADVGANIVPILIFSVFVFIGNPIIIMTLMGRLGYTKRNGFLAGLTVSQISEFSFILIALGISLGHLPQAFISMITIIGLLTMASSSYVLTHGEKIYDRFSNYLEIFERKGKKVDEGKHYKNENYEIILFGYNRVGYSLKKAFHELKKKFLVVDNNPDVIKRLASLGVHCRYGDADDSELLDELPIKKAKMIVSTIPELETNQLLIRKIRGINRNTIFIVVSHQIDDALALYGAGATYVITPHFLGGTHTSHLIEKHGFNKNEFEKEGRKSVRELFERKREGHRGTLHERD
ncbi:cation:proton antiporter [Candidatus Pacearchaeota archaeon]|nr:cation:proton antiporter [Candidatus Pacearchaeota archaeon]